MDEVLAILAILGILFIGATLEELVTTIDIKQIEQAQEICTKANSTISKISKTTVTCANGGEFKYVERKD
jgi:hypothetical protein